MFFDVVKVIKSIYGSFRAIIVHLVYQKIDMKTIVSKIATPVMPRIKNAYILARLKYDCVQLIVISNFQMLLWWIDTPCSRSRIS